MRKRSQRLWLIGAAALLLSGAVALAATALKGSMAFFYGPTDLVEKNVVRPGVSVRLGGLVKAGTVSYLPDGKMQFEITDGVSSRRVVFAGLKPDMFRENEGMIAVGRFDEAGTLVASDLIAKHDENYMPREVYETLRHRAEQAGEHGVGPAPEAGS